VQITGKHVAIGAVICCASVFTAVQGLSYPLLSLMLARDGHTDLLIGLSAATMPAGMIAAGMIGPRIIARFGEMTVSLFSLVTVAVLLTLLKLTATQPWVWFPSRFGIGAAISCLFITTDVWANRLADSTNRGRIMGLYAASMSVGFALGPALLALVGTESWTPFILAVAFVAAAAAPLILTRAQLPGRTGETDTTQSRSVMSFATTAPALVGLVTLVALVEQAVFALLPLWSIAYGQNESEANILLSMMPVGSIVISILIGIAADKLPAYQVIVACCLTAAGSIALLPIAAEITLAAWTVMFLFGGLYYGIYVIALAVLGARFTGPDLVAGGAAFGVFWGIGGLIGPVLFGATNQLLGSQSLPGLLAIALILAIPVVVAVRTQLTTTRAPAPGHAHVAETGEKHGS
jgi:MFS family permease